MRPLLLAALLALPLPALAETRDERVAVASEYVELALQGFDMAAMIETMYQPILQQVAAGGATLTEAQVAQIRQLYLDTFTEPLAKLMRDQAGIMADMMTLAEITALRDFYATPEGRSVMAKLPQLTAAQQPGMMALINDKMTGLMPQVLAIVNGEAPPAPTAQP
ncbi:DUF2059 domain-containing protein [Tabrizicola sp.]|uniref:DUF2059 domain-containing protein n=1 Tax=Tabrizicola sp. TaxID=2005166 RepID=UPI001A470FF3|nr:DUF2059 domain-containing protein [Tabrizicola sp.]MBL9072414.1 DUF2059 domain-containing protein [Tabrizicola sp.]